MCILLFSILLLFSRGTYSARFGGSVRPHRKQQGGGFSTISITVWGFCVPPPPPLGFNDRKGDAGRALLGASDTQRQATGGQKQTARKGFLCWGVDTVSMHSAVFFFFSVLDLYFCD